MAGILGVDAMLRCVCDVYKWSGQVIACKYSRYSARIQQEANVRILLHWIFFWGKRRQNSCSWILIDCTWLIQLEGRVGNHDNYGGPKRLGFGSAMFTCLHHLGEVSVCGSRVEATPRLVFVGLLCQELALSTMWHLTFSQEWPRTLNAFHIFLLHKSFQARFMCFWYTILYQGVPKLKQSEEQKAFEVRPNLGYKGGKIVCVTLCVPWSSKDSEATCWYHATWMHQFPCQKMFVVLAGGSGFYF